MFGISLHLNALYTISTKQNYDKITISLICGVRRLYVFQLKVTINISFVCMSVRHDTELNVYRVF